MDKPTTNWPSDSAICVRPDGSEARMSLEEMAAEALVVPGFKFPLDGEWRPEIAALQQAAGASSALADFYREQQDIEIEIRRYEREYQETGNATIAFDDAVALAERIKSLYLSLTFVARADYIAFLAGRCLTLKEGQASGTVYAALARLEVVNIPQWRGAWRDVTLAIPAELRLVGPDATFGAQTVQWLRERCEPLARELAIAILGLPPDSPAARMFDGGGFAFIIGLTPPDRDAVPVVPAPDEAAIAEYIERAAPDHSAALEKVVDVLCQCGQPLGDALTGWLVGRGRKRERPDGKCLDHRKAAQWPKKALRNHAIIEAIRALERCGMRAMTNDREPGPACDVCARVFSLESATIRNIWKKR